jgi:stage V sporulation protein G
MEVTEVRVKLARDRDDKLRAFCTLTFDDCFVVRDIKIIRGVMGDFMAMPSRKLTDLCPKCRGKNHLRAHYCNECGRRLVANRADRNHKGRAKLYADVAHPIHQPYRDYLQQIVLEAYERELERSQQPGYRPLDDEFPDLDDYDDDMEAGEEPEGPPPPPPPTDDRPPHKFGEGIFP